MRFLKETDELKTARAFSLYFLSVPGDNAWLDVTVTSDADTQPDNVS